MVEIRLRLGRIRLRLGWHPVRRTGWSFCERLHQRSAKVLGHQRGIMLAATVPIAPDECRLGVGFCAERGCQRQGRAGENVRLIEALAQERIELGWIDCPARHGHKRYTQCVEDHSHARGPGTAGVGIGLMGQTQRGQQGPLRGGRMPPRLAGHARRPAVCDLWPDLAECRFQ